MDIQSTLLAVIAQVFVLIADVYIVSDAMPV